MAKQDSRRSDEAIAWAEKTIGGHVVKRELQGRWRPHWILSIDTGNEIRQVLLRGYRNPGYTEADAASSAALLIQEAEVLKALQDVPISLPRYYGHLPGTGWMLMEFREGDTNLIELDNERRFQLYRSYIEQLATLHAYPLDKIKIPASMTRPATCQAFRQQLIDRLVPAYRNMQRLHPEPTVELGLQWSLNHTIHDERPICMGFGDIGAGQFMFQGNELTSLIDIEYAQLCDPLSEIGMMRGRDITYHTGRMPEHVRYYGECYEKLTGIPLSLESLQYWTVAGYALWVTQTVGGTQYPDSTMVDMAFVFAYEVQMKRFYLEAMAEYYGITLSPPNLSGLDTTTTLSRLHQAMIGQFNEHYAPRAGGVKEQQFVKYSTAIAETLKRGDASHATLEQDTLNELSELLGQPQRDLDKGMAKLEEAIARDFRKDLENRLNFLYRYEARREFLYEPMQRASGVSIRYPLDRMN